MRKNIKIIIDVCMVLLLIFLLVGLQIRLWWHVILGYALVPVVIFHVFLNRKWLVNSLRTFMKGEANSQTLYMLFLFAVLTISFIVATISGIVLTQLSPISDDIFIHIRNRFNSEYSSILNLHVRSSVAFVIAIVFHVKIHWKYIKNKIVGSKSPQVAGK